jgi:RecA/RadA recombinase
MDFGISFFICLYLKDSHTTGVCFFITTPYVTGKTQLCHTLCTIIPQDKTQGGLCGKSIYIDTECKFRPERIASIAQATGFNTSYTLSGILYIKAMTSHQQELILEKTVPPLKKDKKIRLLVVDSIINNYRCHQ